MLLLSLNTATHPDYQGQGLFTRLAGMTYEAAGAAGYHGVYGVANANSTPGFVRKLGFQLVRPLEALVGIGPLRGRPAGTAPLSFERRWSAASLAWRCASPGLPVCAKQAGAGWRLDAAALPFIRVYGELPALATDGTGATAMLARHGASAGFAPLRLYLGLRPEQEQRANAYMAIPARLRPSPLNLIYRPLSVPAQQLDAARIRFTFLDFDAY
jgi:GNAT superfamily N-acetyltransferase